MYDLAIAFTWIYDTEFTELTEELFHQAGLSTFLITKQNLDEVTNLIRKGELRFKAILDRASDEDENFVELAELMNNSECRVINDYSKAETSIDKSIMHPKLVDAGLNLPHTIIIPPLDDEPELNISEEELLSVGKPFIIKPAYYSGGSEGVHKNAFSIDEIQKVRSENPDDSYLVQRKIYPAIIENERAWYRVLWAFGKIIIMRWNDENLVYPELNPESLSRFLSERIHYNMNTIHSIAQLDYFSSEFALTEMDELFLIDYVNDQCDFRLKSNHPDGVPNNIVKEFIGEMVKFVKQL